MVRYRKALLVSFAAFATMGIAVANADAPTITGFPEPDQPGRSGGVRDPDQLPAGSQHWVHVPADIRGDDGDGPRSARQRSALRLQLRRDAGRKTRC